MRVKDASTLSRGNAREKMCDFMGVVPLRSSILISVLSVPSRCNMLSNLLTTWTFTTRSDVPAIRKSTCAGNEMRVAAVTHVCIFLNGRQIQTADLNKFAKYEYVFYEKSQMASARFMPPVLSNFS